MTVRTIRYIVNPATACPPVLRGAWGRPVPTCQLDMSDVALCAMGEVLETAPAANPFLGVFEELLVPGEPKLIWQGDGPGRGVEMRRAFSGMFGRFFARAYLERYHGFTWFAPISGDPTYFSSRLRVTRSSSARIDLPDWLCAGPGKLAIGEAKGSHQKNNLSKGTRPGPIKTAEAQINGVRVQKAKISKSGALRWVNRSVKGWAVMSRWGVEIPAREPFLFVLDPETAGEPLSEEETAEVVQDIARVHVRLTLEGLGYTDLLRDPNDDTSVRPSRQPRAVTLHLEGEDGRRFLGAVASPFGLLSLSVNEAQTMLASLPTEIALRLFFVGFDLDMVLRLRENQAVNPRPVRRADDGTRVGSDGLLVAPLGRVSPIPMTI